MKKTRIVRVTLVGTEKTYNMTMRAPHHNYFVNGILSANSHSVAYAHVAYQTAYLKANYPEHFYAAVMTYMADDAAKILKYASELRAQKIKMLPPDINESGPGFTPVEGAIRYGLSAIKGIGQSVVNPIIEARKERPFTSIFDFAERVCDKGVGKRAMESLICAGAFDSLKPASETLHKWRAALLATVDRAIECGARKRRERNSGQVGMFTLVDETETVGQHLSLQSAAAWTQKELLAHEKASVGFYVSGHPLEDFVEKVALLNCKTFADLAGAEPNSHVRLAGVVSDFTVRNTKKGDRYAFFRLEDLTGAGVKCVLWPEALKSKGKDAADDALLLVIGRLDTSGGSLPTIVCDEVSLLETARIPARHFGVSYPTARTETQSLLIEFPSEADITEMCEKVAQTLMAYPGNCDVFLELCLPESNVKVRLRPGQAIKVSSAQALNDGLKQAGVHFKWVDSLTANKREPNGRTNTL